MKTCARLLVITLPLLTACASGPRVQVLEVCPAPPPLLVEIPEAALEASFTERMVSFLRGRLPEPISYELPSANVKLNTTR